MRIILTTILIILGFTFTANAQYWEIYRGKSKIDDSPKVVTSLQIGKSNLYQNIRMWIQCVQNKTAVGIDPGGFVAENVYNDKVKIEYRIDGAPVQTVYWNETVDNEGAGLFNGKGIPFLKKIYNANKIFVRMHNYDYDYYDLEFDLPQGDHYSNTKKAIDAVAETCNWTP